VTAAVNLASTELELWSGIPSAVRSRISYANELTETSVDPAALNHVHRTDLRRIEDLWIDVEPDRDRWLQSRDEHRARQLDLLVQGKTDEAAATGDPPGPERVISASVSLRLAGGGSIVKAMQLEVAGPDRTNVEGLTTRIVEVLNRSTEGPTRIRREFSLFSPLWGFLVGWLVGFSAVRGFNLAPRNTRFEWQEIVIPSAAAIVTAGFLAAFVWALPPLELLDTGERSRFTRFRALLLSGLGAIAASVIAAAVWTAVT